MSWACAGTSEPKPSTSQGGAQQSPAVGMAVGSGSRGHGFCPGSSQCDLAEQPGQGDSALCALVSLSVAGRVIKPISLD